MKRFTWVTVVGAMGWLLAAGCGDDRPLVSLPAGGEPGSAGQAMAGEPATGSAGEPATGHGGAEAVMSGGQGGVPSNEPGGAPAAVGGVGGAPVAAGGVGGDG